MSDKLTDRLRGRYEVGPDAEFGTRSFDVPPISLEAADKIEALESENDKLKTFISKLPQMSVENIAHQADVIKNEAKAMLNEARKAHAQINGGGGVMEEHYFLSNPYDISDRFCFRCGEYLTHDSHKRAIDPQEAQGKE